MSKNPVFEISFAVTDEAHCCASEYAELTIRFEDGGGGLFPVITAKEFALDSPDELARIVRAAQEAAIAWCSSYVEIEHSTFTGDDPVPWKTLMEAQKKGGKK